MPRPIRINVVDALYHVTIDLSDRQQLLELPEARTRYRQAMGRALTHSDARLLAYALLPNQVQLAMVLGGEPLGRLLRSINAGWVQWLNRTHGRYGTAMADRPRCVLAHFDSWIHEVVRYLHNAPVRAGHVRRAEDSDWTSHRAYLGLDTPPPWLDSQTVLQRFGGLTAEGRAAFARYVAMGCPPARRQELRGATTQAGPTCRVLGPQEFVAQIRDRQPAPRQPAGQVTPEQLLAAVSAVTGIRQTLITGRSRIPAASRGRKLVAWLWVEHLGRRQASVATAIGVGPNAITQMLRRMRQQQLEEQEAATIAAIMAVLRGPPPDEMPLIERLGDTVARFFSS